MVFFQTPILPTRRKIVPVMEDSMKKRKREEDSQADQEVIEKPQITKTMKSIFDTELNLETPLPLEWQRYLDIKSGKISYYNSRTQKKTSKDPRASPEPPSPVHDMSLDLELNLPCGPVEKNHVSNNNTKLNSSSSSSSTSNNSGDQLMNSSETNNKNTITRTPWWLKIDDQGEDQQEMVTAVCNKCHILVVMCKSSPSCPNCKFVHPPDQSPPTLFKTRFNLLC